MVVRIAGLILPQEKRAEYALTYIYGVGLSRSRLILQSAKVSPDKRLGELDEQEATAIMNELRQFLIEGDLRRQVLANIKQLKDIGSYRGSRHIKRLPSRGQRTKNNARTLRGKKRTVANKKA